jgi:hypothetical protein
VFGLDLAPTAVQEAKALLASDGTAAVQAVACFEEGDFFTWNPPDGLGACDVGFDYTFGCAMHPSMRGQWAQHWARLLAPGATLITQVFPVNPDADPNVGPPYPVSPEMFKALLLPAGFELLHLERVPDELSPPSRRGREWIAAWRRLAAH